MVKRLTRFYAHVRRNAGLLQISQSYLVVLRKGSSADYERCPLSAAGPPSLLTSAMLLSTEITLREEDHQ